MGTRKWCIILTICLAISFVLYKYMQMHLHVHETLCLPMFQSGYTFLMKKKISPMLHHKLMQTMLTAVGEKLSFCISFDNFSVTNQYALLKRKSKWPDAHLELSFKDKFWHFYLLSLRNIAVFEIQPIRLNGITPKWLPGDDLGHKYSQAAFCFRLHASNLHQKAACVDTSSYCLCKS